MKGPGGGRAGSGSCRREGVGFIAMVRCRRLQAAFLPSFPDSGSQMYGEYLDRVGVKARLGDVKLVWSPSLPETLWKGVLG